MYFTVKRLRMKISSSKSVFVAILVLCWASEIAENSDIHTTQNDDSDHSQKGTSSAETENFLHVRQIYTNLEKKLKSIVSNTIKVSMPTIMRQVYSRNISSICLSSLLQLTGALRQTKLWAFQMLDASGKVPTGFFAGTLTSLGNYEECLGIDVDQPKVKVKGQYCLIEITPPLPRWRPYMSLHFPVPELSNLSSPDTVTRFITSFVHNFYIVSIKTALCTPSSCSKDDIDKVLQVLPEMLDANWKFSVNRCETKSSFELSTVQTYLMYFFILLLLLVGIATITDLVLEEEMTERKDVRGAIFRVLRCFSLKVNMVAINNYAGSEENLRFIYGLIFISVIWIMAANVFIYVNYDIAANFIDAMKMTLNMLYQMLTSRIFPHHTLLFCGAFVTTYKLMKSPEQNICIWKYIFQAYLRYTPTYVGVIALLMLSPAWGSGPSWMNYLSSTYDNCKTNWWTNILYINNYVHPGKMCLKHSWFFAVAAQLHVIGLLVLIPLKARPKIGLFLNLVLIAASVFTVFFTNMYYGTPPNEIISFLNIKDRLSYATQTYHHPHYHLMTYCCGIYAGYLVATKPMMNISPKLSYFLWFLTSAGAIMILCLVRMWSDGLMPKPVVSASYDAFSKLIWALFLLWATVSCANERKGICYDVLSWGAFTFLSRLAFLIIILNPSIVTMAFGYKKAHIFVSHFEIFYNLGTLLVCNLVSGYIVHLCVESPSLQLTHVLKKACGIKTFNTDRSGKDNSTFQCEEVISEKVLKTKPQKVVLEKNLSGRNRK